MTDYFALVDQPRRPWLDPDALKKNFLFLSAEVHPDRVHGATLSEKQAATARYTALNSAYQCLREPKDRLLHLLELELGHKPAGVQRTPADAMELFMENAQLCRDVDEFLTERSNASTPMLKAQFFERGLEWTEKLMNFQQVIRNKQEAFECELRSFNASWESAPAVGSPARVAHLPLARLEELYRLSSYFERWSGQLQERVIRLSL